MAVCVCVCVCVCARACVRVCDVKSTSDLLDLRGDQHLLN